MHPLHPLATPMLAESDPCEYPDKLYLSRNRKDCPIPDAENRTIVSSFVWTKHRNVKEGQTDRQTDRQTDGQTDSYPLTVTEVCIASNADALYNALLVHK